MQLSLIVRGQHKPGDVAALLKDDLERVRRADELGFDRHRQGSHYSGHPFEYVQQIPFLAYAAAIAPRCASSAPCAVAVAQAARFGRAAPTATLCRRQIGLRLRHRLPRCRVQGFGVPPRRLAGRFEECLEAIRRLWDRGFRHDDGSHFELDGRELHGEALQKPTPPVGSAPMRYPICRAARLGDLLVHSTRTAPCRRSSARSTLQTRAR